MTPERKRSGTGGARPKRRGTYAENRVRTDLMVKGYTVIRAYASIGPWDLLAIWPVARGRSAVYMIQVKAGEKAYMRPKDRILLCRAAKAAGATPLLCWYPLDRTAAHWYELDRGSIVGEVVFGEGDV